MNQQKPLLNSSTDSAFSLLDAVSVGICILQKDGTVRFWNRHLEHWTGIARTQIVGQAIAAYFPHLAEPKYRDRLNHTFQQGGRVIFSAQFHPHLIPCQLANGTLQVQRSIAEPIRRVDGTGFDALISIQDVTDFCRQAQQCPISDSSATMLYPVTNTPLLDWQLSSIPELETKLRDRILAETEIRSALKKEQELNRLKSRFVSMVSHEFRTPMTAIRICAELLEHQTLSEQQRHRYFKQIQTAIHGMTQLLDEVLLLGKTESGSFKYSPELINLKDFCSELIEDLRVMFNAQHQMTYTYTGQSTEVAVDRILLHHILTNLLSNAIKYSPIGGRIQLELNCHNNQVVLRIRDHGMGIPSQDCDRLFDPFHRASNVTGIQGTGLGLAIVKNCVELHGGQIEFETEEGQGTTFTVTLPISIV
ncbi:ATP-binding protein [Pantanalinema sp. GBBB05]|uniref:sensor histidine kinase n=1 Tax=Pantanalinema sp. GBBB05 TaxID=2604139 RepID=UPI003D8167D0